MVHIIYCNKEGFEPDFMCVSYMRNVCCKHEVRVIIPVWLMDFEAFCAPLISVNPAKCFYYQHQQLSVGTFKDGVTCPADVAQWLSVDL